MSGEVRRIDIHLQGSHRWSEGTRNMNWQALMGLHRRQHEKWGPDAHDMKGFTNVLDNLPTRSGVL